MITQEMSSETEDRAVILLGAGGHATVLLEILQARNYTVLGVASPMPAEVGELFPQLAYLGDDKSILQYAPNEVLLVNGIGSASDIHLRQEVYTRFRNAGFEFVSLHHPAAILSPSMQHGSGLQVLAGAIIQAQTKLAENIIVNSRAVLEHHCRIGAHCHIASGATVCGGVQLGHSVHVGAGATINQGLSIGDGAIIASGCTVISDVDAGTLVAGVPGVLKKKLGIIAR